MGWGERKDTMASTAELKLNIQAFAKKYEESIQSAEKQLYHTTPITDICTLVVLIVLNCHQKQEQK